MGGVYYNEFNRQKAAWLRHLIEEGVIAHGVVDERSITEVQPEDLHGFAQCHFFAGIGLWSLCLRRAGWPDDRPVWTGSCPCGPFSKAGLKKGFDDPRHLWPEWFRLISVGRPDVVFGEQSDEAIDWIDLVQANMEGLRYALGALVLPAAGFLGAHERHRFGFVADADNAKWWADRAPWNDGHWPKTGRVQSYGDVGDGRYGGRLAISCGAHGVGRGFGPGEGGSAGSGSPCERAEGLRSPGSGLGEPNPARLSDAQLGIIRRSGWRPEGGEPEQSGHPSGAGVDWLFCRDRKWRPVESGTCPLVDADPARMGRLRGYGDAIDVETFTQLIAAYLEISPQRAAA